MNERLEAIDQLLRWGDAVGGEIGGRREVIDCRNAIAVDLRRLGVTDAEMSEAIRAGFRAERARFKAMYPTAYEPAAPAPSDTGADT